MIRRIFFILFLSIGLCLSTYCAHADQLTIAAASNLQFTLNELKQLFTHRTGIDVIAVYGSSGKLAAQIENGAPYDIFMSADLHYPEQIYKRKLSLSKPHIYAYGHLVLWTLKPYDVSKGIDILLDTNVKSIAVAVPKTAPYGRQTINALEYYGLSKSVAHKLVYGENISQVNQFITTQAADLGFTAKSIVIAQQQGAWIDIDPASYEAIAQGIIILKQAKQNQARHAEKFVDFIFSPEAQEILKKYGYSLP